MNNEKLNSWLSLGANVGVVIGLILLIVEINQNTAMMQSQIHQSRTDTSLSEQQANYNSDYIPDIVVKVQSGEALTEAERFRYGNYIRALNRNLDNQLWQYNHGFLGENIPRSVRNAVRKAVANSSLGISIWDEQKFTYTDEYVAFVEEAIADLR
jgi:hypothetical protein